MSAHFTRRFALLLSIIVPVLFFRCYTARSVGSQCPPANPHRFIPEVIQVTAEGNELKPNPKAIVVWDRKPVNPDATSLQPSADPVVIRWHAQGFNLSVKFDDPNYFVSEPQCNGPECVAHTNKVTDGKNHVCSYKVFNVTNTAQEDEEGDIVVMPCCS